jgi:hypothetical protein
VPNPLHVPPLALALGSSLLLVACGRGVVAGAETAGGGDKCLLEVSPVTTSPSCRAHPELCGQVCGAACVDLANDADNCGACGHACAARAACGDGACGVEPTVLVAPAPGCGALRLVHEAGSITWADLGHGTIARISTSGGAATTLVTGVHPAVIQTSANLPLFADDKPVPSALLVHDGTVVWIEAADFPARDDTSTPRGGAGVAIRSVRAGAAPTTLLPAALAPDPSPVSSQADGGGDALEAADRKPPISALALSPDAQTLYFAAGSRLYAIPAAGAVAASDVVLVGFTAGPEKGFATALAADDRRLFFPTSDGTGIDMFELGRSCASAAGDAGPPVGAGARATYDCPAFVFGSFPIALLDTITVSNGALTWAKENNVWRAPLAAGDPAMDGHEIASDTLLTFAVTGFAAGPTHAYFGENKLVERGSFVSVQDGNPPRARMLARGQKWPTSFAVDGHNVYWTTSDCDIAFLADSPQ